MLAFYCYDKLSEKNQLKGTKTSLWFLVSEVSNHGYKPLFMVARKHRRWRRRRKRERERERERMNKGGQDKN
jgi:hypothetical protein